MIARVEKKDFDFAFEAGTSRGVLKSKTSWFVFLTLDQIEGVGECSPIPGLSPEPIHEVEDKIHIFLEHFLKAPLTLFEESSVLYQNLKPWPSIRFALETAYLDLKNGGQKIIYKNHFHRGLFSIPINGLVWMNSLEHMKTQVDEKIQEGYTCIKLKIGHFDFQKELALIQYIRTRYSSAEMMIRVDANGAYQEPELWHVLAELARYKVHSIEQPIKQGQQELLKSICQKSPIPIALDEELIGITEIEMKEQFLKEVNPQYLVLKLSLHGGMAGCKEWINLAQQLGIGWWVTSYLETSIGLNAIAQWVSEYEPTLPQGLGTGKIFENNIPSPLSVKHGYLHYNQNENWSF